MKLKSFLKAVKWLCLAQKIWLNPKKSEIVIYDKMGSEVFESYFKNYNVQIFETRGESIYVRIFIRAFIDFFLVLK